MKKKTVIERERERRNKDRKTRLTERDQERKKPRKKEIGDERKIE